ncbi:hypothetical protein BCR33DRAFT_766946 [Rhizoclosmatium globosum]|uniref:Uncharacterized protein n=1 Tax=Rhizoclosmatium globosum TaxID=329046 RepID=A0A1Y2C603_9FUNG|nr:hypothetical protein BCR33DRAFT_766946 [Rhizoclosmatium globosum]|eukprot:ORY42472.1 hypothetical protein BCR33DRAFT_766946 [Rhizoclosmatium globosum]
MQIIVIFEGESYSDDTHSHLLLAVSALDTDVHEHKVWAIDRLTRALGVSPEHDPYLRCALDFVVNNNLPVARQYYFSGFVTAFRTQKATQIPVLPVDIESSLTCRSIHPVLVDPLKTLFVQAGIASGTVASYVNELTALLRAVDSERILTTKSHHLFPTENYLHLSYRLHSRNSLKRIQSQCRMHGHTEPCKKTNGSPSETTTISPEEQAVFDFFTRQFPTRDLRDFFLEQAALTVSRKFIAFAGKTPHHELKEGLSLLTELREVALQRLQWVDNPLNCPRRTTDVIFGYSKQESAKCIVWGGPHTGLPRPQNLASHLATCFVPATPSKGNYLAAVEADTFLIRENYKTAATYGRVHTRLSFLAQSILTLIRKLDFMDHPLVQTTSDDFGGSGTPFFFADAAFPVTLEAARECMHNFYKQLCASAWRSPHGFTFAAARKLMFRWKYRYRHTIFSAIVK